MIDTTGFYVMMIIGLALMAAGSFYAMRKTNADKKIQKSIVIGLIVLLVGSVIMSFGLGEYEAKNSLGIPIKFSELKDQNYLLKILPSGLGFVEIDSDKSEENEWGIVMGFPDDFNFLAKKFGKKDGEVFYPEQ